MMGAGITGRLGRWRGYGVVEMVMVLVGKAGTVTTSLHGGMLCGSKVLVEQRAVTDT